MSAPVNPRVERPGTVTLVIVLMWIAAILEIIFGALAIVGSRNEPFREGAATSDPGLTQSALIWVGIVTIALGVLTILLAMGLAGGSNTVRVIVTVLIVLQMAADLFELSRSHDPWPNIIGIIFWLIILALLWTSRASAFFRRGAG